LCQYLFEKINYICLRYKIRKYQVTYGMIEIKTGFFKALKLALELNV